MVSRCVAHTFASAACTARRSSTNETASSALTALLIAKRLQGERPIDLLDELRHARLGASEHVRRAPETRDALRKELQRPADRDAGTRIQLGGDRIETSNIGFQAPWAPSTCD